MDLSIRVIAFNTFCDRSRFASRHPHLSVVQVFKDRFRRAVSFDSSAAERRDYEEPSKLRQALRTTFFNLSASPCTAENPRHRREGALYTLIIDSQAVTERNSELKASLPKQPSLPRQYAGIFIDGNATDTPAALSQAYSPRALDTPSNKKGGQLAARRKRASTKRKTMSHSHRWMLHSDCE
jgi:hypothetical protein